jgi:hypothetical protein
MLKSCLGPAKAHTHRKNYNYSCSGGESYRGFVAHTPVPPHSDFQQYLVFKKMGKRTRGEGKKVEEMGLPTNVYGDIKWPLWMVKTTIILI